MILQSFECFEIFIIVFVCDSLNLACLILNTCLSLKHVLFSSFSSSISLNMCFGCSKEPFYRQFFLVPTTYVL